MRDGQPQRATPRFFTLLEDEGGTVLDSDEAFTQMFGYTAAELIGQHVLDQIHPDGQARAVEGVAHDALDTPDPSDALPP